MEFHPVLPPTRNGVIGTDSTNISCPESVLKGEHRYDYDRTDGGSRINAFSVDESLPVTPRTYRLTAQQVHTFHKTGVLVIRSAEVWTADELKLIVDAADEMDSWPEAPGKWMKYYEKTLDHNGNKLLQRMENFIQYSAAMDYILNGSKLLDLSSQLFGESAILYKEKINYKLPGGAGFDPHQDVAAGWWMYGQSLHISCLIGIDPATKANGALQVVYGEHTRGMLCEPWKELTSDFTATANWELVPTQPGDIVFFDSYVPHRSERNTTDKPRRVLYATYAKASEGDWREKYYADKRISFPPDCERLPDKKYEYKI